MRLEIDLMVVEVAGAVRIGGVIHIAIFNRGRLRCELPLPHRIIQRSRYAPIRTHRVVCGQGGWKSRGVLPVRYWHDVLDMRQMGRLETCRNGLTVMGDFYKFASS